MLRNSNEAGFTLLEVLFALLIMSISLIGLIGHTQDVMIDLRNRQEMTLATIVANNLAIETRLSNRPSIGKQDGEYKMADISWPYQKVTTQVKLLDVTKTVISLYPDKAAKTEKRPITTIEMYLPTVNIEKKS